MESITENESLINNDSSKETPKDCHQEHSFDHNQKNASVEEINGNLKIDCNNKHNSDVILPTRIDCLQYDLYSHQLDENTKG